MRLASSVVAVCLAGLAALVLAGAASAALWQTPSQPKVNVLAKPAYAAWLQSCKVKTSYGTSSGTRVMVRRLAGSLGAAKQVAPCASGIRSLPALTYANHTGRVYAVWAHTAKDKKTNGVYVSSSKTGLLWTTPRRIMPLTGTFQTPVVASAYAYKIWVMWSAGMGSSQPFHIRPFDVRTWRGGPEVAGIANFKVYPGADSMKLFATRDGVAAFWKVFNVSAGESDWHFADTLRVNPTDLSKRVAFVYRGKVGLEGRNNLFVGLNGLLYRLLETPTGVVDSESVFTLSRWRFLQHRFAPAYANAEVARVPTAGLGRSSVSVAAQVDAGGNLRLAYIDKGEPEFPSCLMGSSYVCSVATPSQPFRSYLKVLRVNRDLSSSTSALPMPLAVGPQTSKTLTAQAVLPYRASRPNTFVSGPNGLHLTASYFSVALSESVTETLFLVPRSDPTLRQGVYLSPRVG